MICLYRKKILTEKGGVGVNSRLLKSFIVRYDEKQSVLADAMGLSLSRLNAKINGTHAEFTQGEMDFIRLRYNLTDSDFRDIFFTTEVS